MPFLFAQILDQVPHMGIQGECLLADLEVAMAAFTGCNALACLKAQQEVALGHYDDALASMSTFMETPTVAPSCWAIHLAAHIAWLAGNVPSVCPPCLEVAWHLKLQTLML